MQWYTDDKIRSGCTGNIIKLSLVFGDQYLCYMSVTSQALKIYILPSMEGNMLGIVYWFLCSLCKGGTDLTDDCTPKKLGANRYSPQRNIVIFRY